MLGNDDMHPLRLQISNELLASREVPLSSRDISMRFKQPLKLIAYHLHILETEGRILRVAGELEGRGLENFFVAV